MKYIVESEIACEASISRRWVLLNSLEHSIIIVMLILWIAYDHVVLQFAIVWICYNKAMLLIAMTWIMVLSLLTIFFLLYCSIHIINLKIYFVFTCVKESSLRLTKHGNIVTTCVLVTLWL